MKNDLPLNDTLFWHLIELLDWSQEKEEAVIAPLVEVLAGQEEAIIFAFQEKLSSKLYDLDHKIYAKHLGYYSFGSNGAFSADYFLYARAFVVAKGNAFFKKVKREAQYMPKEEVFEALLELAPKAYRKKTGKRWNFVPSISYETFSNPKGWEGLSLADLIAGREAA